jgi:hypothetical protein
VNVIGETHKHRVEALRWLQIDYEVSFKSSVASSARCASRQRHCSGAASSAAPSRPQRKELAVHAQDEEGDDLDRRIPSSGTSSARACRKWRTSSTASASTSPAAHQVSHYSAAPYKG